jgi:hypothetical protein
MRKYFIFHEFKGSESELESESESESESEFRGGKKYVAVSQPLGNVKIFNVQ